jgi:predicted nucleic acid-binding protein
MRYFLDTSALVKIYHKEEGSENVLDVYKRENMNISELSIVEFLSTVYRNQTFL